MISKSGWRDHVLFHFGLVPPALNDFLATMLQRPAADDQIYMCGPAPFMDTIREAAVAQGWSEGQIFFEHFSAAPPATPLEGDSFFVRLQQQDRELLVPPDKTIVEVLRDEGIEITTSCEQGICGTCVTRCIEGEPDHRDHFLSDQARAAGDVMTICVSRARGGTLTLAL